MFFSGVTAEIRRPVFRTFFNPLIPNKEVCNA
jgi:hypothetical protein